MENKTYTEEELKSMDRAKRYYIRHREEINNRNKAYYKKYYEEHKKEIDEKSALYYEEHKEEMKQSFRDRYYKLKNKQDD